MPASEASTPVGAPDKAPPEGDAPPVGAASFASRRHNAPTIGAASQPSSAAPSSAPPPTAQEPAAQEPAVPSKRRGQGTGAANRRNNKKGGANAKNNAKNTPKNPAKNPAKNNAKSNAKSNGNGNAKSTGNGGGKGAGGGGNGNGNGGGNGGGNGVGGLTAKERRKRAKKAKKANFENIVVEPVAPRARMRMRHWGMLVSLVFLVFLPLAAIAWYLWERAEDQYASVVGFTVRSEEGSSASDLVSGLLGGGSAGPQKDTDILYEFIQSQGLVSTLQDRFDLRTHYAQHYDIDPFFAVKPDASAEDLLGYWSNIASVSYDQASGLIEMRVQAFEPQYAQDIARAVIEESQQLINTLNAQSRDDAVRYAKGDLEDALERLKEAREALTLFRTRTQIVDPESDLKGRLGVVANLQQQLAQSLIEQDLLLEQTSRDDPRLVQAKRKIEVIRARIDQERQNVSSDGASGVADDSYPTLLAEYEGLQVDREFAEGSYRAALTAVDAARTNASRQSRYLAAYIQPTFPQTAEYPRRVLTMGLAALFVVLLWSIVALIYYSVRDSK